VSRLPLTLACQPYDRMAAMRDGTTPIRGVDLNFLSLPVEETFYRMLRFAEFDAAELSLSSYVLTLAQENPPFVALPVFPSRAYRHSGIYVRADSPLRDPSELPGLTVGVPEYQITAAVWIRGILQEHYGVGVSSVRYRTGGLDEPGRKEKVALDLPDDVDVRPIGEGQTLSQMLLDGEIDALYSARNPGPYNRPGHGGLRRLFDAPGQVERAYARETGIFPIMHTLVIRRDVYERAPWVAQELYLACIRSKDAALERISETASLITMLPWLPEHTEEAAAVLGSDWWAYGVEPNRRTLETFLGYSADQGLAARRYRPEELFAPETLERFTI
jgi:4,5-dihydroxyphthalate decarboxylase